MAATDLTSALLQNFENIQQKENEVIKIVKVF